MMTQNQNPTLKKTKKDNSNRKTPKKITADRLRNIALYYLQRYASGSENLRQVLVRRVRKTALVHPETDIEQAHIWIDDIVSDMQRLGYVNDDEYARMRAESLYGRGTSHSHIRQKLKQKGLDNQTIENALHTLVQNHGDNGDLYGAIRYAKRRRLGVYRTKPVSDLDHQKQKDIASLARNGFSWEICQKIIQADDIESLESLLD